MSLENIERMLRQRIGLHAESVGRSAISSAVGRRMATRNISSVHEYFERLNTSTDELHELIETVVIPETWFFRDGKPFQVLKKVAAQFNVTHPGRCMRALSVPCSTGEEPYSIAMTLLEAGLAADRIQIDAIDISRRALDFARAGSYGSHSFRGEQDPVVLERYFTRDGTRFHISPAVRARVQFAQANLLAPGFQLPASDYDVIFCRNLMIYFDDRAKELAYRTLQRLLTANGLLFVGHAECGTVPPELFHSAGHAFGFAFRKGQAKSRSKPPVAPRRGSRTSLRRPPQRAALRTRVPPAPTPERPDGDPLELARQLADLGRLQEARAICEKHLKCPDRPAQAYFLLGTICLAEQTLDAAEQALRRALYLDPKHYEALVQMTALLERRGERSAAARMRQRADRAAPQRLDDAR